MLRLAATAVALVFGMAAAAQTGDDFVPVTDKMLQDPDPADWLSWRRTLDGWAYSPLDAINKGNVAQLKEVWSQPSGHRQSGRHAARLSRRHVYAEPRRLRAGVRREDRGALVGVSATISGRRHGSHEPQPRDLGHDGDRCGRRQHAVRDRRTEREARLGDAGARPQDASPRHVRSDHRRRQDHHGPAMPARRDSRSLRRDGARCGHRQGAVARAHDSAPGRARR